jgi:hypothetical protein
MRVNSDTVISYDVHYASLYRTLNVVPPKNCRYWTKVPFINSTTGATISLAFATCVLSRVLKDFTGAVPSARDVAKPGCRCSRPSPFME